MTNQAPVAPQQPALLPDPPDGSPKWLIDLYAHTHWDREWYMPFERYRLKLVAAIDRILDVLAADPAFTCYVLDGQTIVVDDYLELRPERADELGAAIRDGRIEVGPWYILPDEFLVSGESIIRNLLEGRRGARRFAEGARGTGGLAQEPLVGYLPDPFGHIAQLPQLLAGFGIRAAIFSRGMGDEYEELGSEFEWLAEDGESSVVAVVQAHVAADDSGYCNASFVGSARGWDAPELFERADQLAARLAATARTNVLLFAAGEDHASVNAALPRFMDGLASRHPNAQARIVGLRQLVEDVLASVERRERAGLPLQRHRGELRGSRNCPILANIFSARIPLKQDNVLLQSRLERYVEPMVALAAVTGIAPPDTGALRYAWRLALQNQPHDSIGGCSVDATHDDMPNRTKRALEVGVGVLEDLKIAIGCDRVPIVFNPHTEPASAIHHRADGAPVFIRDAPPLQLVPLDELASGAPAGRVVDERTVESDAVRVQVDGQGRVAVTLFDGDVTIGDALRFVDTADAGDEYDFAPLPDDQPIAARLTRCATSIGPDGIPQLTLLHRLDLPRSLSSDRRSRSSELVECELQTVIRVANGLPWAECVTSWTNAAADHRLRIAVALGAPAERSFGDGHFAFLERPGATTAPTSRWRQDPVPVRHCESCAAVPSADGTRGVALLTQGLHEYELTSAAGGTAVLELAILRSVGWLSRDDIPGRPGHAGPELAAPDGQCLGPMRVRYAIAPFAGDPARANLPHLARRFVSPPAVLEPVDPELTRHMAYRAREMDILESLGGAPAGLARFNGHGLTISGLELSAVKPADDGSGELVVRGYNAQAQPVEAAVRAASAAGAPHLARLDETLLEPLADAGETATVTVPPGGIRTIRFRP